jgi:hypothetical protein
MRLRAAGYPLVPGSSKSFPGTQGLPVLLPGNESAGSGPEWTWDRRGRYAIALNRLLWGRRGLWTHALGVNSCLSTGLSGVKS